MKLHPFMVEALYLRQHPTDTIVKDGKEFFYSPFEDKYFYFYLDNPKRKGLYEAKGLMSWWKMYLRECENWEFPDDEDLPY